MLALAAPAAAQAPIELPQPVNLPWERQLPSTPGRSDIQPHAGAGLPATEACTV